MILSVKEGQKFKEHSGIKLQVSLTISEYNKWNLENVVSKIVVHWWKWVDGLGVNKVTLHSTHSSWQEL